MLRRSAAVTCAVLVFLALHAVQALADEQVPGDRPDIIVVMVDDLGAVGERVLERLPNIKSLWLQGGLKFQEAYSETPLCCPGRATFLTGQHTRRHGVVVNDARLLDADHTIATALDDAGYFTVMSGKYLNGASLLTDHTPPGWDRVAMLNSWSRNVSSEWSVEGVPRSAGFFDRFAADRALEWLTTAPAGQPLFMWLTPHAPHKTEGVPNEWVTDVEARYVDDTRCDDVPRFQPPSYSLPPAAEGFPLDDVCRSLLTVDEMVGRLQAEVTSQGRDPYWVLTSDNGMSWGAHGFALKNVPTADRLPLYVAGPGVVRGETSALISNIDVAPTLAGLAGVDMPRADGMSFERVLRGQGGRRRAMLQDHPVGGPTGLGDVTGPWWGIRTRSWRLVVWRGTHLYQTEQDRWEMKDLATKQPETALRLARMWGRLMGPHGPAQPPFPALPIPTPTATPPTLEPTPSLPPQRSPTQEPGSTATPGPGSTLDPTPLDSTPPASATATPTGSAGPTPTAAGSPYATGTPSPVPSAPADATSGSSGDAKGAPGTGGPTQSPINPQQPDARSTGDNALLVLVVLLGLGGAMSVPFVRRRLR